MKHNRMKDACNVTELVLGLSSLTVISLEENPDGRREKCSKDRLDVNPYHDVHIEI